MMLTAEINSFNDQCGFTNNTSWFVNIESDFIPINQCDGGDKTYLDTWKHNSPTRATTIVLLMFSRS